MKTKFVVFLVFSITLGIFSCSKSTIEDIDLELGYDYFPLEIGQSRVYAVDSIIFDPGLTGIQLDTLSGFMKEDVVDTLRNNAGALVFRIERYYRKAQDLPWDIHSVISSTRENQEATITENNLRSIKLIFPLKAETEWQSTAYFPETTIIEIAGESLVFYKGWKSTVLGKEAQFEVDGRTYSDVFLVELANFENKIEYRYGQEVYAPNVGMVYQEVWVIDTQCEYCCNRDLGACDPLPWTEKGEKGMILKRRLIQ